jgi:hypothetical protein
MLRSPPRDDLPERVKQHRVERAPPFRLLQIGHVPTVAVVALVGEQAPRHAKLPARRQSPEDCQLYEVPDVPDVPMLHS